MSRVVYVDTETTGLDPDLHEVWEVAAIDGDTGIEHVWLLPVGLPNADPIALAIGGFHDRHPRGNAHTGGGTSESKTAFAVEFGRLTHGAHLVGAVPSFDEERLRKLLLDFAVRPSWHHHLIDVEAMAVGWLRGRARGHELVTGLDGRTVDFSLPWKSDDLSRACGVEPPSDDERHTALGDARWAKRWYEQMTGGA